MCQKKVKILRPIVRLLSVKPCEPSDPAVCGGMIINFGFLIGMCQIAKPSRVKTAAGAMQVPKIKHGILFLFLYCICTILMFGEMNSLRLS
jgi:hypothetical protein